MRRLLALLLLAGCSAGGSAQPGDRLDAAAFWRLVGTAAEKGGPAVEDRAAVMTQLLGGAPAPRLESWQQHLVSLSEAANTTAVAAAFQVVCKEPLPASQLGPWLVAQGQAAYDGVLADPDALADVAGARTACEGIGEAFGAAATGLYSDLGFEPGSEAFPYVSDDPPAGPPPPPLPRLQARYR